MKFVLLPTYQCDKLCLPCCGYNRERSTKFIPLPTYQFTTDALNSETEQFVTRSSATVYDTIIGDTWTISKLSKTTNQTVSGMYCRSRAVCYWHIMYPLGQAYSSCRNSQKPANQHHNQLMICKEVQNIKSILQNIKSILHIFENMLHYSTMNWDSQDNKIKLFSSTSLN